jgi:hypothetical protein
MKATQCWEHALAGSRWLLVHQKPDGSWGELVAPEANGFYKTSWAFMMTGQPVAAHRLLNYVQQHFMTGDGDFGPRGLRLHQVVHYPYLNAYLVAGSMLAARYEIAMPALHFLAGQQDAAHGGFYSRRTDPGHAERCDTMSTAAAGAACLVAGRLDCARRAADFLAHIVELQPAPSDRFYTMIEADRQLATQVREAEDAWWQMVDTHAPRQCWYGVGYPFSFLLLLYQATCETRYRTLADWYFDFQVRCVNPWSGPSSGKAGWGCALLYRMIGDARYRDIALQVADYIVGMQEAEGNWFMARVKGTPAQSALDNPDYDVTAEYTLWLALIASNILARDLD